jgi:hypothetical protein
MVVADPVAAAREQEERLLAVLREASLILEQRTAALRSRSGEPGEVAADPWT